MERKSAKRVDIVNNKKARISQYRMYAKERDGDRWKYGNTLGKEERTKNAVFRNVCSDSGSVVVRFNPIVTCLGGRGDSQPIRSSSGLLFGCFGLERGKCRLMRRRSERQILLPFPLVRSQYQCTVTEYQVEVESLLARPVTR